MLQPCDPSTLARGSGIVSRMGGGRWREREGEGGRRKREGWKDHERKGGRVKREELRGRNCDSILDRDRTEEIYIQ